MYFSRRIVDTTKCSTFRFMFEDWTYKTKSARLVDPTNAAVGILRYPDFSVRVRLGRHDFLCFPVFSYLVITSHHATR